MSRIELDLTQTHQVNDKGDYTLYQGWYGERLRPCLALMPTRLKSTSIPLVVTVDDAWKWNPDDPEARPEMNAVLIGAFVAANGIEANSFTFQRIVGIIHDHLGDLMSIPPKALNLEVVGDAYRTDADGTVSHKEIRDHV
ncbi:hypothetical protein SKUL_9 [Pseudomonas phage Skulduggery]|uniref:Uncharacterized protein n=1 Tax=Pseudomonas phage Skulduggery TaxID=2006671 RepID=A0A1Y0T0S9_9CAUD|nr:hypothetical protein PP627_gp09 [Pseudomonas phage Skulduggery]ARV77108.1 hypothetical protein SKUL_9 [Pseudomonas phage Skulduggery]